MVKSESAEIGQYSSHTADIKSLANWPSIVNRFFSTVIKKGATFLRANVLLLSNKSATKQSVRNVVSQAAEAAETRPYTTGGRGEPADITPHTYRHSVAYRMLNREEGNTLYDVTKRLRHATIVTTERVYSHFDRV